MEHTVRRRISHGLHAWHSYHVLWRDRAPVLSSNPDVFGIRLITQRSMCIPLYMSCDTHTIIYRVILASIGSKGLCPCPRCLIPLGRFQNLGMIRDMKQRETLARADDNNKRRKVDIARQIIYQKKYAVDSKHVKYHLKDQSLTPTAVSSDLIMCNYKADCCL